MQKRAWSRELAKTYKEEQQKKADENVRFVAEDRIGKDYGQKLWGDLCTTLKDRITDLNSELGEELIALLAADSEKFVAIAKNRMRKLVVRYNAPTNEVLVHTTSYRVVTNAFGMGGLQKKDANVPSTLDDIAEAAISDFVRSL